MPSTQAILDGLATIANQWRPLAILWHVSLGALAAASAAGWRPANRTVGRLIAAPVLCVAVIAGASGNPFNASTFLILGVVLLVHSRRLSAEPVRTASPLMATAGSLLLAFGWFYPHFLDTDGWMDYAYAAPLGLIPCPTLSAAIGLTLVSGLLGSTTWSAALASAGLVYGAIGVFRLGVAIDSVLLAGAAIPLVIVARDRFSRFVRNPVRTH